MKFVAYSIVGFTVPFSALGVANDDPIDVARSEHSRRKFSCECTRSSCAALLAGNLEGFTCLPRHSAQVRCGRCNDDFRAEGVR